MKRAIITILLVFIVSLCLFAERSFTFSHIVGRTITFSCSPVFLEVLSDDQISTEKTINSGNTLARLALSWEGSGSVGVALGFSPLFYYGENGDSLDSNVTADYGLEVKIPSSEDPMSYTPFQGEKTENTSFLYNNSSIQCRYVVELYSTSAPFSVGSASTSGVTPVAAFTINLDGSAPELGVYKGTIYAVVTTAT